MEIQENREVEKVLRLGFGYIAIPEVYEYEEDLKELNEAAESIKKRKFITQEVLTSWSPATNNDRLLDWECLRTEFPEIKVTSSKSDVIFHIPKKLIKWLPSPESYTRARRTLNNQKIGLPTNPYIIEKRKKRERAIKKYFGGKSD